MGKKRELSNRYVRAGITGLVVACLFLVYAIINHITPLGDNFWFVYDMNRQYIDFYSYYKSIIFGQNNLFYSFGISLGAQSIGFYTYYLSSPFLILSLFFDEAHIPEAITLMIGLKLVLAGAGVSLFMTHVQDTSNNENKSYWPVLLLSICYAFSSFGVSNSINPMWLDVFYIMPVFIWMTDRLLFEKKRNLYIVSLALMIMFNYYIAFMVCIFTVIWTLFRSLSTPCRYGDSDQYTLSVKSFAGSILNIGLCSVWAVAIDCVMLIPTVLELANSPKDISVLGLNYNNNNLGIDVILSKTMFGAYDVYQTIWGTPLIYAGTVVGILTILYFLNREIKINEKIGIAVMMFIFLISFLRDSINMIWHAGMEPSGYPYREAFMFVLICLFCAIRCIGNMNNGTNAVKVISAFVIMAVIDILVFLTCKRFEYVNEKMLAANLGLIVIVTVVLLVFVSKRNNRIYTVAWVVLLTVTSIELIANSSLIFRLQSALNTTNKTEFSATTSNAKQAFNMIKENDKSFFRMENLSAREQNDPMMFDYNGVTHYSSSGTLYTRDYLMSMGYNDDGLYADYGKNNTCTADTILGIKYLIGKKETNAIHPQYESVDYSGEYIIKENPNALSVASMARNISDIKTDKVADRTNRSFTHVYDESPFEFQENLISDLAGEKADIFVPMDKMEENTSAGEDGNLNKSIDCVTAIDGEVYFYIDDIKKYVQNLLIYVDDEYVTYYGNFGCLSVLNLGYHKAGEQIRIYITSDSSETNFGKIECVSEDFGRLTKLSKLISDRRVEVTRKSSSKLVLKLPEKYRDQENAGIVTTIPYDKGWSATSQGKKIMIKEYCNSMMQIDTDEVENGIIEMSFVPEGFYAGLAISIAAVLLLIIVPILGSVSSGIPRRDLRTEQN